jgi:pantoate--beta-alanine ligase
MLICQTIEQLHSALQGASITALVPTMGNLHAGHIALVKEAKLLALQHKVVTARAGTPKVVVSIFVNRLQFGAGEDFDRYPRTFAADCNQLRQAGTDIVFAPDESVLYPQQQRYFVEPDPSLADILEGAFRPGHFRGVCTVVMKLFAMTRADVAFFGKKDYQQLMVLSRMVEQLNLPIQAIGLSTVRADDGLALSSRNGYLTVAQRQQAPQLFEQLQLLREQLLKGDYEWVKLEKNAISNLSQRGWHPDYISVRLQANLEQPKIEQLISGAQLVIVAAAKLGQTRLIDNLEVNL